MSKDIEEEEDDYTHFPFLDEVYEGKFKGKTIFSLDEDEEYKQ